MSRPGDGLLHLPLEAEHERIGARFAAFAGWWLPLHYGSDRGEHLATRSNAGLFDLTHMAEIIVSGDGAVAALDLLLTADLQALPVGRARYCFLCNEAGGVVDDLVVYRLAPDRLLVVANAANHEAVLQRVAGAAARVDAAVADDTGTSVLLALQGPAAAGVLGTLAGGVEGLPARFRVREARIGATAVLVSRTGYTGEDGFELFVRRDAALELYRLIIDEGEGSVVPAGLAARDSLRLEAGLPLFGHELGEDISPYDAGLGRFVDLDKSVEFVGRAALEQRASAVGTRALVGLRAMPGPSPRAGDVVSDATRSAVGVVTSGAPSPSLGVPIAMAFVAPEHAELGTELVVQVREHAVSVLVVELPFYRRG